MKTAAQRAEEFLTEAIGYEMLASYERDPRTIQFLLHQRDEAFADAVACCNGLADGAARTMAM